MRQIEFKTKGKGLMVMHDGKSFNDLIISNVEKRLLNKFGNLVIDQNRWMLIEIDGEYFVERYS